MSEIVPLVKLREQRSRKRVDEIACFLVALTYGEMIELADAIWQVQPEGLAITRENLSALLHRWSTTQLCRPTNHCNGSKGTNPDNRTSADKTNDLHALVSNSALDWSVQHKLEYIKWAREVAERLRGTNPSLEKQFDETVRAAEQLLSPGSRDAARPD